MDKKYVIAKSFCTPSKLPASDFVINPYVGCTHHCVYCYACFMGRFTGHKEKWGTYLEAKKYISYKLPRNLDEKTILIGSVTDAYNQAEKTYTLMPKILEQLENCPAHIEILTKSKLILRDIDLIKKITDISVGISLSNLIAEDNKIIEPGASTAEERIETLRVLHEAGINTYLFIAPYLPGITDVKKICAAAEGIVDYVCVENLNLRGSYKQPMLDIVKQQHSEVYDLWQDIYIKNHGKRYWLEVENKLHSLSKEIKIPLISYMYHEKIKKS